jgi:hypothetical protein
MPRRSAFHFCFGGMIAIALCVTWRLPVSRLARSFLRNTSSRIGLHLFPSPLQICRLQNTYQKAASISLHLRICHWEIAMT